MAESVLEQDDIDCLIGGQDLLDFEECESNHSISTGAETQNLADEDAFLPGTEEFRKARKRRQNRESAARNRARKRTEASDLEAEIKRLTALNLTLKQENAALRSENQILKGDKHFTGLLEDSSPKKKAKTGVLATAVMLSVLLVCFFCSGDTQVSPVGDRRLLGLESESSWRVHLFLGAAFLVCSAIYMIRPAPRSKVLV